MKVFRKIISLLLLALLAASMLCACHHVHRFSNVWSVDYDYHWKNSLCDDNTDAAEIGAHAFVDDVCSVCGYPMPARVNIWPVVGEIHTETQKRLISDDTDGFWRYADGRAEKSKPLGINIAWWYAPMSLSVDELSAFQLTVCHNGNVVVDVTVEPSADNISCYAFYNAYLNATYVATVAALDKHGNVITTAQTEFTTASEGPRNVFIEGVTNARDIGGYVTSLGAIKQGMMYRTARLNASNCEEVKLDITTNGIGTMLYDLKIKSEIDLRGHGDLEPGGITSSVLGDSVNYYLIKMVMSDSLNNIKPYVKQFFDIVSDENNYPLFFHCHIGTDRTGVLAFLCEALLGADEDVLYTDYLFSNLGHIGSARWPYTISVYIDCLNAYEGETLSQRTENYLYDCGVTPEQVTAFKNIMLEKNK